MEIVDNRKYKKEYTFESLLIGTVFIGLGKLYLKISNSEALNLETVTTVVVADYLIVEPVKAHLVLED